MLAQSRQGVSRVRMRAVEILTRVEGGAFADPLLQSSRVRETLDGRDRGLLQEIVLGTITYRAAIDHVLAAYVDRPLPSLNPRIRNLLRAAVYQIRYLDRVPDYAVVSESVDVARRLARDGAARFVNAILRGISESRKRVRIPDLDKDPAGHLAVTESYPGWLAARWVARYGVDVAAALCRAGNVRPPLVIRANAAVAEVSCLAAALAAAGITSRAHPDLEECLIVGSPESLFDATPYHDGLFFVQGPGAVWVTRLLGARPGERILDVCAAPGGKACAAAAGVGDAGRVVALDDKPHRIGTLTENARRLRLPVLPLVGDARRLPMRGSFDAVLVDAPCSALGVIAGHPEIKWLRSESDIADLAEKQLGILESASEAVAPGGRLVYATCTTEPEENEGVIDAFLRNHPEYTLSPAAGRVSHPAAADCLHILPAEDGSDGAFAACLVRR